MPFTQDDASALIDLGKRYWLPIYHPRELVLDHGLGARVWDTQGRDYIDFGAGIAVNSLGHQDPDLLAALITQAHKLWHASNVFYTEPPLRLAEELVKETPDSWMPQQFENPANVEVHERTTAREILADFPDGLDAIITGVGTGGHIMACANVLKPKWPKLKVFAVEPTQSAVLSGGQPGPHAIQGLGAGFIPAIMDPKVLDGVIQVEAEEAREMARRAAREEGMLVGISSGAALAAIARKLPELGANPRVLGFCYDTGERYLSVEGFLPA